MIGQVDANGGSNGWLWDRIGPLKLRAGLVRIQLVRRYPGYLVDRIQLDTSSANPPVSGQVESAR